MTNQPWLFAKTYADDSPHEYIVRTWDSVSESMFVSFATFIRDYGYEETYQGRRYTCLDVGNQKYWTMGNPMDQTTILNRRSYEGYDVLKELREMGEDPSDHVDVSNYVEGTKSGAAKRRDDA